MGLPGPESNGLELLGRERAREICVLTFPVVAAVVVTVMNKGPATFEKVSGSPSGSVAVRVWFAVPPSRTVMFAG